jgi:hypothetical protein
MRGGRSELDRGVDEACLRASFLVIGFVDPTVDPIFPAR